MDVNGTPSCGPLTLNAVGAYTVTGTATDNAGDAASGSANCAVAYGDYFGYSTTSAVKAGTKRKVVVQLMDAGGKNYSASSIPVTAIGLTNSSKATQLQTFSSGFAFAKGQCSYTFDTTGLARGTYYRCTRQQAIRQPITLRFR